jgi:hypothetical protein
MTQFTNKSFNVLMRSGSSPSDIDERWRRTFGEKMPSLPPPVDESPEFVRLADVFALLDREAEKSRLCGDLITAEIFELVRAKMRALEKP